MINAETISLEVIKDLGLEPAEGGLFIGRRIGFPIGLKILGGAGDLVLLFQVRHPFSEDAKELQIIRYDTAVRQSMDEKRIEVEFDDKMAWVSLIGSAEQLEGASVRRMLDSVLASFKAAGLARDADLCHYCQREKVDELGCMEGKVVQVCARCLNERLQASAQGTAHASEGSLPITMLAPIGAVVGAVGWAALWIGYDLMFDWLSSEVVVVPRFVEFIALLLVAGATGGPVGWAVRNVRRRGHQLSVISAASCTILAVVAGEVGYVAWLIYREIKVFSLETAWRILPKLEMEMGGFHLLIKLVAVVCAIVVAVEIAKPRKAKLGL